MPTIFQRICKSTVGVCQRRNLSEWQHEPSPGLDIYGMYHVWCAPGWESMVREQIGRLVKSGLLARTKKLFVSCIVKEKDDEERLLGILGDCPVELVSVRTEGSAFEFPALDYMYEKSQHEDFLFYYFHTKGISYQSVNATDHLFLGFNSKIVAWRNLMEYFIMDQWQVAVNVLDAGWDTYGCYLFPPFKETMYAGNFWWAKSGYFRSLPKLDDDTKKNNRFMAEEWLLSSGKARAFSAFDTVADLYDVRIDEAQYVDGKSSWFQSLRFFVIYTFRKYQKKWFHYSYKHRCQARFQKLSRS